MLPQNDGTLMYAVVYSNSGHYYVKTDYKFDDLPAGWELVKTFDNEDDADEYRNVCLADQHLQREEQRAADRCNER